MTWNVNVGSLDFHLTAGPEIEWNCQQDIKTKHSGSLSRDGLLCCFDFLSTLSGWLRTADCGGGDALLVQMFSHITHVLVNSIFFFPPSVARWSCWLWCFNSSVAVNKGTFEVTVLKSVVSCNGWFKKENFWPFVYLIFVSTLNISQHLHH